VVANDRPTSTAELTSPVEELTTEGLVLGSHDAMPLEFRVGVEEGRQLELDDLLMVETVSPRGQTVRFFGIVDAVRKRYEGAQYDTDAFRASEGTLPVDVSYTAHVQVTRIDPEIFIPPHPGDRVRLVRGEEFQRALYFDQMQHRVPVGLTRTGEPVYANLEFLDGTRGAHASISGVSGVATKTSYGTFLLYALFHSKALGTDAINSKALIFNVKGEDLLWLDRPNVLLDEGARAQYARLGLPIGAFQSVGSYAPTKRQSQVPIPDTGGRQDGIKPYLWTMREFARDGLLRFAFVEAEAARAQLAFVVIRVERALERASRDGDPDDPVIEVGGRRLEKFEDLVDLLDGPSLDGMVPGAVVLPRGAVKLVGSRRPVGKVGETHGVFPGLSIGDRAGAVRWGSAQPTVHKFTAPPRHGVRRPVPAQPSIGQGTPRPGSPAERLMRTPQIVPVEELGEAALMPLAAGRR